MPPRKRAAEEISNNPNSPGFIRRNSGRPSSFRRGPSFKVAPLRAKQPKLQGSCVEHPIRKTKFMMFSPDPDTVLSDDVVRKYTLHTSSNPAEQQRQFASIEPAVYNYILFANQDTQQFTLHLMRMNPMEYYSKHIQIMFDAKHIAENSFVYSGEMRFDGSRTIVASDMSSLYFLNLKNDAIVFAMKLVFPDLREHMGPRGKMNFENLLRTFAPGKTGSDAVEFMYTEMAGKYPKAEKQMYLDYYNKFGFLLEGKREEVDRMLQDLFVQYMRRAVSGILGPVTVVYNKEIFALSDQRFLTGEFMGAICRVKDPRNYPTLFDDSDCTQAIDETWCSYVNTN